MRKLNTPNKWNRGYGVSRLWFSSLFALFIVLGFSASANATLIVRGQGSSAYGTYNLVYDSDLNITWYDYTTSGIDRRWNAQNAWANNLVVDFGGVTFNDWRLPVVQGCAYYNCNNSSGEMAYLYYKELGNSLGGPLANTGVFQNLQPIVYWSGTERLNGYKYTFDFSKGTLGSGYAGGQFWAYYNSIAVRPGDVGALASTPPNSPNPMPAPGTLSLISTGLLLAVYQRHNKRSGDRRAAAT